MKILVINAGSSSVKFGIFDTGIEDQRIFKGEFEGFKDGACDFHYRCGGESGEDKSRKEKLAGIEAALEHIPAVLKEMGYAEFEAVGHRVAHGGEQFKDAAVIDDAVLAEIGKFTPLAPLHNPLSLKGIEVARKLWPQLPHVAVFDTAFHHTIPESAHTYAVPQEWREKGLRRYGFHGTSHKYVGLRVAKELQADIRDLQIISCHLGNGASVCAINRGFSVDTSMGMTPLEGLVMGTRSGDVDPGLFSFLKRELGLSIEEIEQQLYHASGLKALSGISHDMREIERRAAEGDANCQLAINVYAYRVRKYIGAYAAAMGGVDVVAFTGGIGENSASMRRRVCDKFGFLGLYLDEEKNAQVKLRGYEAPQIQQPHSRIHVLVTQTCEQYMIAQETKHVLTSRQPAPTARQWKIPVAVSARHVHLTDAAVEALFGKGYKLKQMKQLVQPEGWAAEETVDIVGPKGTLKNVRILGPNRNAVQIEVSRTDTFVLGVEAPVRPSGKVENTPFVTLKGPAGELVTNGLIIAARHIHTNPEDAVKMGLQDGDYVDVQVGDGERGLLFTNTLIRAKPDYVTEMHIDTDEANAAGIHYQAEGEIVFAPTEKQAEMVARKNMRLNHNHHSQEAA